MNRLASGSGGNKKRAGGGSSYIDSLILRDRDADTGWTSAADDKREERRYYCQNWRADISAILTDSGSMVEWVKYSSYGVPFALPAGDTDSDGDWDLTDKNAITAWTSGYDVRYDTNLDGTIAAAEITHANSITGGYQTLGRGVLSSSAVANHKGYAGYEYDPTFEGAGRHLYHVRHRVYDADVGRWLRRDPLGYVDGMSLYEYARCQPILRADSHGMLNAPCAANQCSAKPDFDWPRERNPMPVAPPCPTLASVTEPAQGPIPDPSPTPRPPIARAQPPVDPCFAVTPVKASASACQSYALCDSYAGANARCFCECAGDSAWSAFVRACLLCKYASGATPAQAHEECDAEADRLYPGARPWATLAMCYIRCRWDQVSLEDSGLCGPKRIFPRKPWY